MGFYEENVDEGRFCNVLWIEHQLRNGHQVGILWEIYDMGTEIYWGAAIKEWTQPIDMYGNLVRFLFK
jgi:hypothetical protein